ncbi:MAG TPA: ABC transporter ATP-binding protein [Gammaproteobacteria bacterium]|nr:ABC transporter ATP-binding protein [Gammaproteobacteria bacterium]
MTENAITIEHVAKSYNNRTVLADVSMRVKQGEYFGLVGMNGAGKTTLIKGLLDLCAIDKGSVYLYDIPHRDRRSRKRVTYLPEKFTPPYYLTGRDYMKYMAELNGRSYIEDDVLELFSILELDISALDKPVRQFSKGMGQKLGLAGCLSGDRDLLVFDEPMSGLDPGARACLKRHLIELKSRGRTLFCSTHLLEDVRVLCDRMAILHEGEIRFIGSPAECCDTFQTDDLEQAYLACTAS